MDASTDPSRGLPSRQAAAPLPLVLLFTFLSSLGTGVVNTGIYFLTKHAYGFGDIANFWLALILGITYIVGAFFAGRAVSGLRRKTGWSTRTLLALVIGSMGAIALLPAGAQAIGITSSAPVWILIVLYSPLSGVLWPIVESYQSGGRKHDDLRKAMGFFNVTWCSAIVVALWAMGPFVSQVPIKVILFLGCMHLATIGLVMRFPREPGSHDAGSHAHPEVYERLLRAHRLLLPMSYIISSALNPFLPGAMDRLGVAAAWTTPLAASLQVSRVLTFAWLGRWRGWHGRWSMPIIGTLLLLVGFAAVVLSPALPGAKTTIYPTIIMVAGLFTVGFGMAAIYTAALYYALEVGNAEVDAGGTHEALIGIGYTVGPLCWLLPSIAAAKGQLATSRLEPIVVITVGAIAIVTSLWAFAGLRKREPKPPANV